MSSEPTEAPVFVPNGHLTVPHYGVGIALTIIPLMTGTISFFSSAYLIWEIMRGKKCHRSREGLLVGLSFLNLLFSAACAMSTFTGPEEMNDYDPYIILGNTGSCNFQGWLYQAGTAAPMYNSALSVYYLIRIKYKISDRKIRKCALPSMHVTVLAFAFGTATTALFLELYNFSGMLGCWINDQYIYCIMNPELESCGRGSNHELYLWLFGGFPVLASLTITMVTTVMLYCSVRSQEAIAHDHDHENNLRSNTRTRSSESVASPISTPLPENENTTIWRRFRKRMCASSEGFKISATVRDSGVLYVVAFWITYLPFLTIELIWLSGKIPNDYIRIANVTLLPLQGFFNVIVYKIPQWQRKKESRRQTRNQSSTASAAGFRRSRLLTSIAKPVDAEPREPSPDRLLEDGIPMTVDIIIDSSSNNCTFETDPKRNISSNNQRRDSFESEERERGNSEPELREQSASHEAEGENDSMSVEEEQIEESPGVSQDDQNDDRFT